MVKIKNDNGKLITNPHAVVDKFKSTFAELLNKNNRETIIPEPDIIIKQDLIEPTDEEEESHTNAQKWKITRRG